MKQIRVLVVDDSLFMRKFITRLAEKDPSIEVVGTARHGAEGVRLVKELQPDVVTMDVEMPVMNGLEALTRIMREIPTRVLMLSSVTREGAEVTIRALQSGAVDFIAKPEGLAYAAGMDDARDEIIGKIKAAARTPLSVLIAARRSLSGLGLAASLKPPSLPPSVKLFDQIVAIGTSTGGPKALETVLGGLPVDFPCPILIVQHMPAGFTASLAERLNQLCRIRVEEARDGRRVEGGTAYLAPGGHHMTVEMIKQGEYRIRLNQEEPVNRHRPSVDVLFQSVTGLTELKRHYVLMTGMGSDGAQAMADAKRCGASSTIAEAMETCVVYGMPRSAVELDCVDYVLPLTVIAAKLRKLTGSGKPECDSNHSLVLSPS